MDPESLYQKCLNSYVSKLNYNVSTLDNVANLRYLPPGVLIDIYLMISKFEKLHDILFHQLSDLEIFERLLRFEPAKQKLFRCLSVLMSKKKPLAKQLQQNFLMRYDRLNSGSTSISNNHNNQNNQNSKSSSTDNSNDTSEQQQQEQKKDNKIEPSEDEIIAQADLIAAVELRDTPNGKLTTETIDFGLRLGSFFSEAGWLTESVEIFECVANALRNMDKDPETLLVRLDCLQRLLHSETVLCSFRSAVRTFDEIVNMLKEIPTDRLPNSLLANTYTQFSALYFARSEYDDSHMWSVMAMRHLDNATPMRIAVDVLRQAAKACVVKRDFQKANMLICQATTRARNVFGEKHQKYADALLDYGFFLLNVDSVCQSVVVYKEALEIKLNMFGSRNFHEAIAHEDLSYAYYVLEYSSGNFDSAREHVEKAVEIMKELVPSNHLMLASAKRVKALLLEEIALDKMTDGNDEDGLLRQSEDLHKFALSLSLDVFGERNVQTAKHYGNLGRLYQTMNRFEEAESMHQKAIKIKTDLLGPYDYEVGLSIGHLASLYNYQMKKYTEAEELYLRSIEISLRLFGRSYSGLEYDYLGLCHIYETINNYEKFSKYATFLDNWQTLRSQNISIYKTVYPPISDDCDLEYVQYHFFNTCTSNMTACN